MGFVFSYLPFFILLVLFWLLYYVTGQVELWLKSRCKRMKNHLKCWINKMPEKKHNISIVFWSNGGCSRITWFPFIMPFSHYFWLWQHVHPKPCCFVLQDPSIQHTQEGTQFLFFLKYIFSSYLCLFLLFDKSETSGLISTHFRTSFVSSNDLFWKNRTKRKQNSKC